MDLKPKISCIIVNWNGWQDTVECLHALRNCTYPNMAAIVVDNGSTNDSVTRIRTVHPHITLLESERNLGFAGGNNLGIRYALDHGADYLWLLNNDTIPAPDALSALVDKALIDRRIAAVASVCYYADMPSKVQVWAGARVNLWVGYSRKSIKRQADNWFHSLYGASLLISRTALQHVGLLDEGFFLYWEETELCLRMRKKGWLLAAAHDSCVLHKVNASTGGNGQVLDRYFTASGLRLLRLHSAVPSLSMLLFLSGRFARRLYRFRFSQCKSVWAGMQDYLQALPVIPQIR